LRLAELTSLSRAGLYVSLFSGLLAVDAQEAAAFSVELKEGGSLMSERGYVYVEMGRPDGHVFECYVEPESEILFQTAGERGGGWPVNLELRNGSATLLFTSERFFGLPVLVEFSRDAIFELPPDSHCLLTLGPRTTMALASFDTGDAVAESSISLESIAKTLLELAQHDALEAVPGLKAKGLRINLGREG